MELALSVLGSTEAIEEAWIHQLKEAMKSSGGVKIIPGRNQPLNGNIIFIDRNHPRLDFVLKEIDRRGRALFLVVEDGLLPKELGEGRVDDVIAVPFRTVEVLSRIRYLEQVLMWNQVSDLNANLGQILKHLRSDLQLAERLHKKHTPKRFPNIKGFQVSHRYLAGLRPGGDHFDIAESQDGSTLALVYFHSTSYGLAGSILSMLMTAAIKISATVGSGIAPAEVVKKVSDEILLTMSARDEVSLFFGIYSRKDRVLKYVSVGKASAYFAPPTEELRALASQGGVLTQNSPFQALKEERLTLSPGSRFALVSEGFVSGIGGAKMTLGVLAKLRKEEASQSLNELGVLIQNRLQESKQEHEMDLPAQDCTVVILDASQNEIAKVV